MTRLLLVCAGGAVGAGARYLLTVWLARVAGVAFPWGTLAVNVTGCFLLALLVQTGTTLSEDLRIALATGVLGGFTTYSAFNYDATAYLMTGDTWTKGALYMLVTVVGSFAAGLAGLALGRFLRAV